MSRQDDHEAAWVLLLLPFILILGARDALWDWIVEKLQK